jgi:hypothetical protein
MHHLVGVHQRAASLALLEHTKPSWLELAYVDEREDARTAWVVVTLDCNDQLLSGTSPAVKKGRGRHGLHRAALATLRAIELFAHHQLAGELVDIACVTARSNPLVVVRVRIVSESETVELFGVARVEGDLAEAAARAVLDAANVYVHSLLAEV